MEFPLIKKLLALVLIMSFLSVQPANATSTNIYVAPTGSVGDGTSCTSPGYVGGGSIATAVAAANDGDSIILCNGTFSVTSQIFINEKEITISGESTATNTIINGAGSTTGIFKIASKKNVTIQNLTFYRGKSSTYGGAISLSLRPSESLSSTRHLITNNIFAQNYAGEQAGAIWGEGDDMGTGDFLGILTISNNTFVENIAEVDGGAIVMAAVAFSESRVIVQANKFLFNRANGRAGGALVSNFSRLTSTGNYYFMNSTGAAGDAETLYGGVKMSDDVIMNTLTSDRRDCRLENLGPTSAINTSSDNPYCLFFDGTQPAGLTVITRAEALAESGYFIPQSPKVASHAASLTSVTLSLATRDTGGTDITQYSYSLNGGTFINFPAGNSSTQTITGLSSGTDYEVRLKATNAIGTSYESSPYSVSTLALYDSSSGDGQVLCSTSGYFKVVGNVVTENSSCVGSVVFPEGVTSVGANAFSGNIDISSVTFPNTVLTIGLAAFYGTTNLASVTFASSSVLETIQSSAFEASGLTSIVIPNSVVNIGLYLFARASSLTSVTLPAGITYIGESMFESASALTTVNFPNSVTTIEGSIFKNATSLSSFTIPSGVTSLDLNAFENTPALTSYTYCGTLLSDASLVAAGLGSKTRNSCASPVVYTPPPPVSFLKTLTPPKISVSNNLLSCTAGTYRAGYTIDGVVQGNSNTAFTPNQYTFTLLINGVAQADSQITTSNPTTSWTLTTHPSGTLITCSVTVTFNSITNVDKSSDNTEGLSTQEAKRTTKLQQIQNIYQTALNENSKTYSKALVENRAKWRKEIENIRTNYYETLARIAATTQTASTNRVKLVSDRSTALKVMIAAQKKSAADYAASKPASLLAKESANKAALATREAAVVVANAEYGAFIQSIGHGALVP